MACTTVQVIITIPKRPDVVPRFPATIIGTVGLVVAHPDACAIAVSVFATRYDAAGQQDSAESDHEYSRRPA